MPDSPTDGLGSTQVEDVKPATTAEPSNAEQKGVVENNSMFDAVKTALQQGAEKSPGSVTQDADEADSSASSEPEAKADGNEQAREPGELTAEEMAQLSPKTQRRMRYLASERREQATQIEALTPKAESFDTIVGIMRRENLSSDDVDRTFKIAALIKNRPEEALKVIAPIVRTLLQVTGHSLPDDLKKRVESGEITQELARELSVSRKRGENQSVRSEMEEQQRQEDEQARQSQAKVDTAVRVADEFYSEKASSDPDWPLKQGRVLEKVELAISRNGFPNDAKEARSLYEEVLKEVNAEFRKLRPAKTRIDPPVDGSASSHSKPEPQTLMEAMKQGLAQGARA